MDRYGRGDSGGERGGYDASFRSARGGGPRGYDRGLRGYDSRYRRDGAEPRGYDAGWGMTGLYQHMMRGRRGRDDSPPLREGTTAPRPRFDGGQAARPKSRPVGRYDRGARYGRDYGRMW
jgi:hypothetical protein